MDFEFVCASVNIEKTYGSKITVSVSEIDKNSFNYADVINCIDLAEFTEVRGESDILDFFGDDAITKYLTAKGYTITN